MSTKLNSLFNSARQRIIGLTAQFAPIDDLFPKVDPAIDGEDCDHDCESCAVSFPRGFKIDEGHELYGQVKGWSQHVLVATGKTDWVREVAHEKGSVMEAIEKAAVKPSQGVSTASSGVSGMSKLTSHVETDALGLEYPHAIALHRLLGTDNGPSPASIPCG